MLKCLRRWVVVSLGKKGLGWAGSLKLLLCIQELGSLFSNWPELRIEIPATNKLG